MLPAPILLRSLSSVSLLSTVQVPVVSVVGTGRPLQVNEFMEESKAKTSTKSKTKAKKKSTTRKKPTTTSDGRSLVIVESPKKAKTIGKILGKKYAVESSVGHVRDLPKRKLGIDIEKGFEPEYQAIPGKKKVLTKLRKLSKDAPTVYLAPDPDREGEAIAWHLAEALRLPKKKVARVTFNEITSSAVRSAFTDPGQIDMDKVDAQQARRVLDRLVGYQLSPLLWKKIAMGLSAGRVQSVALKLIVDREREIQAFNPEEFWRITATLKPQDKAPGANQEFTCELKKIDGKKVELKNEEDSQAAVKAINGSPFVVEKLEERQVKSRPLPPLTTSHMQQAASTRLGFSTKRTMVVAQQLYEGIELGSEGSIGLISYMRTDSVHVAEEAIAQCRELIPNKFGKEFLSPQPLRYKSRRGAQGAHEAIRPTNVSREPDDIAKYLTPDQLKLYRLIWNRFVASQMASAKVLITSVSVAAGPGIFAAKGRVVTFPGHFIVSNTLSGTSYQDLPPLQEGQTLDLAKLEPTQHFTKPPSRFTEATLVRILEREGIGRPSTYSAIVSTIQDRGYVRKEQRAFHATDLGMLVTDKLVVHFPDVVNTKFTSHMEENLDKIEEGQANSGSVLKEFYDLFSADLERAKKEMKSEKENTEPSGVPCPSCEKPMIYRWSKHGRYLACSAYPECSTTMALDDEGKPVVPEESDVRCEKCDSAMVMKSGRNGKFLACSKYPECKFTLSVDAEGKPIRLETTDQVCEKCGAAMVVRSSRRGPFLACSAYPKCKNAKPIPTGIPCPEEGCDGQLVQRGARGGRTFYGCSNYPKCKHTAKELPKKEESDTDSESS